MVFVKGKADYRRERPNILASEVIPLEKIRRKEAGQGVRITPGRQGRDQGEGDADPHDLPVPPGQAARSSWSYTTDKGKVYATADRQLCVNPDVEFCRKMRQLVGDENFALTK